MGKLYYTDGYKMEFNFSALKTIFETYMHANKMNAKMLEEDIANKLQISTDTVHGWHYNKNAPSGLEYVIKLANALDQNDYHILLTKHNENNNIISLNDRQLTAAKHIYDICLWFLDEFINSNGFYDTYLQYISQGSNDPELDTFIYIDTLLRKINLVYNQEYFDLKDCEIYNRLCEYSFEYITNIHIGTICYEKNCDSKSVENPIVIEKYNIAMIRLNEIIDLYVR